MGATMPDSTVHP